MGEAASRERKWKEGRTFSFRFFPKEYKFLDLLEQQVDQASPLVVSFKETVGKGHVTADSLSKMRDIEHPATKPRTRS